MKGDPEWLTMEGLVVGRTDRSKSKAQLLDELRLTRRSRGWEAATSMVNTALRWGGLCVLAYFGYRSIAVLAGEVTIASIAVRVFGKAYISHALAALLAGGGIVYGLRQRNLRRSTIERLSSRIQQLEQGADPGRTSSRLTSRGETAPGDDV